MKPKGLLKESFEIWFTNYFLAAGVVLGGLLIIGGVVVVLELLGFLP